MDATSNARAVGERAYRVRPTDGGRRREFADYDALPEIVRRRIDDARVPILASTVVPFLEQHGIDATISAIASLEEQSLAALAFEDAQRDAAVPIGPSVARHLATATLRLRR